MYLNRFNELYGVSGELKVKELEDKLITRLGSLCYHYIPPMLLQSGPYPASYSCSVKEIWGDWQLNSGMCCQSREEALASLFTRNNELACAIEDTECSQYADILTSIVKEVYNV